MIDEIKGLLGLQTYLRAHPNATLREYVDFLNLTTEDINKKRQFFIDNYVGKYLALGNGTIWSFFGPVQADWFDGGEAEIVNIYTFGGEEDEKDFDSKRILRGNKEHIVNSNVNTIRFNNNMLPLSDDDPLRGTILHITKEDYEEVKQLVLDSFKSTRSCISDLQRKRATIM